VTGPRLLTLMGSGETSPTMVKTHRDLLARVAGVGPAVLLDTPFGFQANADELCARAQGYFKESVGASLDVASFRSSSLVGSVAYESMLGKLRSAGYVFAGPGSPTYALSQWSASSVPELLASKLREGGAITFASAAALTMGVVTVPVYEIYKVGSAPAWAEGLDLLGSCVGLSAAVIPHYNNAEGGTHDTRFSYLGEERLSLLEASLPAGAFVLGIDEHTGLVLDLEAGTADVVGLGVVTIRSGGTSSTLPAGSRVAIADLRPSSHPLSVTNPSPSDGSPREASLLTGDVAAAESSFDAALAARDMGAAVQAILDLEQLLHAWSADTLQSDDLDRGRAALRSMVVRLGDVAVGGAADPRSVVGPFVEVLLDARRSARSGGRYADADLLRDALVGLGVEVRDTASGTEWSLG
jgi:hypothetical protein